MARANNSGTRGLFKRHQGCGNTGALTKCDCAWRGKYRRHDVHLAKWARKTLDPRTKGDAIKVLTRLVKAIDDKVFDPAGEHAAGGTDQRLADLIAEYETHHIEQQALTGTAAGPMLGVIKRSRLGAMTLEDLATGTPAIQEWLDITARARKWTPGTWRAYRRLLRAVCRKAIQWKRLQSDPTATLEAPRGVARVRQKQHRNHRPLDAETERRLFAACDLLDAPKVHRSKLTQAIAEDVRTRVDAGETQKAVAAAVGVSRAVVCDIVQGRIWNPARYAPSTKGAEMRRRLMAAFDTGLRAGETIRIQVRHVVWSRPLPLVASDGTPFNGYEIVLPPAVSKGGKTTDEDESVFVASLRLSRELEARRFALKNAPDAYLFGTETGGAVKGFRRLWRRVFTAVFGKAGWGRAQGLTWHTTRHEFISRVVDTTGDPVAAQEAARHKDLRTTEGYIHVGLNRKWSAVAGVNGSTTASNGDAIGTERGIHANSGTI